MFGNHCIKVVGESYMLIISGGSRFNEKKKYLWYKNYAKFTQDMGFSFARLSLNSI